MFSGINKATIIFLWFLLILQWLCWTADPLPFDISVLLEEDCSPFADETANRGVLKFVFHQVFQYWTWLKLGQVVPL